MGIASPARGQRVRVESRPTLTGEIIEVVSDSYVVVKFDDIQDPVGAATDRLVLHP